MQAGCEVTYQNLIAWNQIGLPNAIDELFGAQEIPADCTTQYVFPLHVIDIDGTPLANQIEDIAFAGA